MPERAEKLAKELGVRIGTDNRAAVHGADVILLAVKPMQMAEVLKEIRGEMTPGRWWFRWRLRCRRNSSSSIWAAKVAVVRAMPNTPCAIGVGMTGIARGSHASEAHWSWRRPCSRPWGAWWWWTKSTWTR